MTSLSDADEIRAWLEKHKPTQCPTVALARTTATMAPETEAFLLKREIRYKKGRPVICSEGRMSTKKGTKSGRTRPALDILGDRYGKLVVEAYDGLRKGKHWWRCRCDCGGEKITRADYIRRGDTTSCGCLRKPK